MVVVADTARGKVLSLLDRLKCIYLFKILVFIDNMCVYMQVFPVIF